MPRRNVELVPGEYYHVYNRGHNRDRIFFERENYLYFLRKLRKYVVSRRAESTPAAGSSRGAAAAQRQPVPAAQLIAYCLMPNHYHLLVRLLNDCFPKAMQSFGQSYTNAVNKRFSRVGSLFQDRFQAILVDREAYLVHLTRYIHLNPVQARLVGTPEGWEFSSYRDYTGLRYGTLCTPDMILSEFPSRNAYREFVRARLRPDDKLIHHLLFDET